MIRTDSGYVRNLNTLFVSIFFIVVLLAIWHIRGILMLAAAGMILTISFTMPVRFFMGWRISRALSIIFALATGILVVILLFLLVFPTLIDQFSTLFTTTIPNGINQLIELWNSGELYDHVPYLEAIVTSFNTSDFEITPDFLNQMVNQITQAVNQVGGSVIPIIGGVASALVSVFIVIFVAFYLIAEPDKYIHGVVRLTPLWYRDRMREILVRIDETIRAWIQVTGISMLLVGSVTGLGLAMIGVQQWLALAVLAGIVSFIPNFSLFLILIPTVSVTIVQVPEAVWIVVLIVLVVSFVQAQIVGPIITSEAMNLPPVLILVGQIIFGVFFGFLGLLLAVPLTAISVVLVEEIYIKDVLGDNTPEKSETDNEEEDGEDYQLVYAEAD